MFVPAHGVGFGFQGFDAVAADEGVVLVFAIVVDFHLFIKGFFGIKGDDSNLAFTVASITFNDFRSVLCGERPPFACVDFVYRFKFRIVSSHLK